jgi:hypothetical protein
MGSDSGLGVRGGHGSGCGRRDNFAAGRFNGSCGCYWDLHRRDFNGRHFGLCFDCNGALLLSPRFNQLG